jgi:hypothetical protein
MRERARVRESERKRKKESNNDKNNNNIIVIIIIKMTTGGNGIDNNRCQITFIERAPTIIALA